MNKKIIFLALLFSIAATRNTVAMQTFHPLVEFAPVGDINTLRSFIHFRNGYYSFPVFDPNLYGLKRVVENYEITIWTNILRAVLKINQAILSDFLVGSTELEAARQRLILETISIARTDLSVPLPRKQQKRFNSAKLEYNRQLQKHNNEEKCVHESYKRLVYDKLSGVLAGIYDEDFIHNILHFVFMPLDQYQELVMKNNLNLAN